VSFNSLHPLFSSDTAVSSTAALVKLLSAIQPHTHHACCSQPQGTTIIYSQSPCTHPPPPLTQPPALTGCSSHNFDKDPTPPWHSASFFLVCSGWHHCLCQGGQPKEPDQGHGCSTHPHPMSNHVPRAPTHPFSPCSIKIAWRLPYA
jgi:hypothetical protein